MSAWIEITMDHATDEAVIRLRPEPGALPIETRADLGMNPTWPSGDEVADLVCAALREAFAKEQEYFA